MKAKLIPPPTPELLRVAEFAERLKLSVWTARRWAYAGTIASVKLGSLLMVPSSELERVISEGMRPRLTSDSRT